jgi:hypothetical protein
MLLLQAAWILTVPPFRGSDEFDHAFRAAAVANGQWVAGDVAEDGRGQLVVVPEALVAAAHAQCEARDYTGRDNCSPVRELPGGEVEIASAASSYHPAFYWVIGTTALPFDGAGALYAMRIATALLSLLFIALAVWATAKLPGRWPMAGLVLAITPVFLYSTTVAAPNGVEMSAGLALWGTLLALIDGRDRRTETRLLWGAILCAVVLGTLRVLGPVFILMIVLTVASLDWGAVRDVISRQRRSVLVGCALVAMSVAGQALWMFDSVVSEVTSEGTENPATFNGVNVLVWPLQTIAAFPLRNQAGAAVIYPVVLILVAALLVAAWRRGSARARLVTMVSLAITLLFPFVFTLATLASIGNIWQGRYVLPYGVGFLLLAGYALGSLRTETGPPPRVIFPGAAFYAVGVAACLIKVRHDELEDNLASIQDAAWHAPSPVVLATLVGVAFALFTLALVTERSPVRAEKLSPHFEPTLRP